MKPIILGLTGSIGSGKSTTLQMLRDLGYSVHDADEEVHQLLRTSREVIEKVAETFPQALTPWGIDRHRLSEVAFESSETLRLLEKLLHPEVLIKQLRFIQTHARERLVALDVPLLFETNFERFCDYTLLVQCDFETQRQRVLERPGMTEEKFRKILAHQMTEEDKVQRANYILETGFGTGHTLRRLKEILEEILTKESV